MNRSLTIRIAAPVAGVLAAAAASPNLPVAASSDGEQEPITLVAYDSFPVSDTPLNAAIDQFTADTGIEVEILQAGDTGTMTTKAVLTAGNPEGDVLFGIDNTYLSRATDGGVFDPYEATGLDAVDTSLREGIPTDESGTPLVTPVDFGDVCVNVDTRWFDEHDLALPTDFESLTDPAYADLLVVPNPASSSPGLAFLLGTVAEFGDSTSGDDGWLGYWDRLVDNGVEIVDDWSAAYYESFSAIGGGDRPLAVSYGSSPPFEVIYADPPVDEPVTTALADTCVRQVEYAGVLDGTDAPEEARALVDFLISHEFQSTIALDLFVFPVRDDVELAPEFEAFAVIPESPHVLAPADIAAGRDEWIDEWTEAVLGG